MSDLDQSTIKLTVDGTEYPLTVLDTDGRFNFTPREWGVIRRVGGVLPVETARAVMGGDQEFYVALALVAMRRSGRTVTQADEDHLLDSVGLVDFILPEEPVAANGGPPTSAPEGAEANEAQQDGATSTTPEASGAPC